MFALCLPQTLRIVPDVPNRIRVALVVAVLAQVVATVVHGSEVSATAGVLRSRPPAAVAAGIAETAKGVAIAAQLSRKFVLIRPFTATIPTAC